MLLVALCGCCKPLGQCKPACCQGPLKPRSSYLPIIITGLVKYQMAWTERHANPVSEISAKCFSTPKIFVKIFVVILILIHSFYTALFSALEQTHCAHWHVILNEWLDPFIARIINIHGSGILVALCGCCMAGTTWNAAVSAQVLYTLFNHAPGYSVTSFKAT